MQRRDFIKRMGLLGLGMTAINQLGYARTFAGSDLLNPFKKWIWITPEKGLSSQDWFNRFDRLKKNGFDGVLVQVYSSHKVWYANPYLPVEEDILQTLISIGKQIGIEVHAWIWVMPNNNPDFIVNHPEFYAVNGLGQPSYSHPAYVGYYKFMCPNNPDVQDFLRKNVEWLANIDDLDGIHLDYIRFPDVIIAKYFQPVYKVIQDREYPQFDYCYCNTCRTKFKTETGIDPLTDLTDPSANEQWRQFRYNSITNLVNNILAPEARKKSKTITAAVFPNWESVRQEWSNWQLDAFFPMLYHNFYEEDLEWIGKNIKRQIADMKNPKPIYAGLFLPSLNPTQLGSAVEISINSGAKGISLFSYNNLSDEHMDIIKGLTNS